MGQKIVNVLLKQDRLLVNMVVMGIFQLILFYIEIRMYGYWKWTRGMGIKAFLSLRI